MRLIFARRCAMVNGELLAEAISRRHEMSVLPPW
jgi:hypothetical protein